MSENDKKPEGWLEKYIFLSNKIDFHRTNAEKLKTEIDDLERKLGKK